MRVRYRAIVYQGRGDDMILEEVEREGVGLDGNQPVSRITRDR
jgi:hypothetical protein